MPISREKRIEKYKNKKYLGLCTWGGCLNLVEPGYSRCLDCAGLRRNKTQEKYAERKRDGVCRRCGKNHRIGGSQEHCLMCYLKYTSKRHLGSEGQWNDLLELFKKQNKCPYTKKNLDLGINTSLDHIVPIIKGGAKDISNFQWVYNDEELDINWMKGKLSHNEFKEAVRIIYNSLFLE